MIPLRSVVLALAVALGLGGCAVQAQPSHLGAAPAERHAIAEPARSDGVVSQVTIDSRYGHGSVSGPVRRGSKNLEVRLPGGTWIDCARNCAETLRRETVDFWESRGGRNDPIDGPAYLRWGR